MVSHGNLMHNLAYLHHCAENDAGSVSVSWLPVYHDMGLVSGLLLPVYEGYRSYLMAPAAFLQRPFRWLDAITRYRATSSGGVTDPSVPSQEYVVNSGEPFASPARRFDDGILPVFREEATQPAA